jgi:uncharacterized GH25 family protein
MNLPSIALLSFTLIGVQDQQQPTQTAPMPANQTQTAPSQSTPTSSGVASEQQSTTTDQQTTTAPATVESEKGGSKVLSPHGGRITGHILHNGKPVAGVEVTLIDPETNLRKSVTSSDKGLYVFPRVAAGAWIIRTTVKSQTKDSGKFAVATDQTLTKDISLD